MNFKEALSLKQHSILRLTILEYATYTITKNERMEIQFDIKGKEIATCVLFNERLGTRVHVQIYRGMHRRMISWLVKDSALRMCTVHCRGGELATKEQLWDSQHS